MLTAKHGCGHLLWPTNVSLPGGEEYSFCVGKEKSAIKIDVLKAFQNSMVKANITHGFYYSLTNNFYLNVASHVAHHAPKPLPGQQNVNQTEFEAIALAQVAELWTNYGQLGEVSRAQAAQLAALGPHLASSRRALWRVPCFVPL